MCLEELDADMRWQQLLLASTVNNSWQKCLSNYWRRKRCSLLSLTLLAQTFFFFLKQGWPAQTYMLGLHCPSHTLSLFVKTRDLRCTHLCTIVPSVIIPKQIPYAWPESCAHLDQSKTVWRNRAQDDETRTGASAWIILRPAFGAESPALFNRGKEKKRRARALWRVSRERIKWLTPSAPWIFLFRPVRTSRRPICRRCRRGPLFLPPCGSSNTEIAVWRAAARTA